MRAIAIKIKNYADHVKSANIVAENMHTGIRNALLLSLGGLAVLYVFLLGNMVWNIIERKALEVEARTLGSEVADLEQNYLALSNKVDLSFSHSLGFKEIQPTFATRKALGSIKILNNEI